MQVTIPEARNRLPQLIKLVQPGAEVVLAEGGEPVARLVPAVGALATTVDIGRASAILYCLTRHPLPADVRRSPEEMAAAIQAERNSWD
jgi:prevent-host-death family protein